MTTNLVYVIDDDPVAQIIARKILEKFHVPNHYFQEAREALRALQSPSQLPDIIFLDINMPICNGWQFLKAFAQLNLEIPIYMLSSSVDTTDIERAQNSPLVQGFIVKPLSNAQCQQIFQEQSSKASTEFLLMKA